MFHRLYHRHALRTIAVLIVAAFVLLPLPSLTPRTAQAAEGLPKGVPSGATEARVWGWVDGDTLKVRIGNKTEELQLTGVDAPETAGGASAGDCYGNEANDHLRSLVSKKQTVYLEKDKDNRDDEDRLLRYLWVPGEGNAKALLLNTKQVRDGYAAFEQMKPNTRYDTNLKTAHRDAKAKQRGLWEFCASVHAKTTLAETTAPSTEPTTEAATQGFTADEQAYALTVGAQASELQQSFQRFGELFQNPRIGEDDWTFQVATELAFWRASYNDAQQMTPPAAFADIHATYVQALSLYASAGDDIAYGIDNYDAAALESAADKLNQGNDLLTQASTMLTALQSERGITAS
jgi:micrococcal nuclease